MLIDFKNQTTSQKYNLMASAVIPRPIAWIATQGEVLNIAPFSYFTPLSSQPPTFIISIGHKRDGSPKDTLRNLRDSKVCTISIIEEDHLGDMNLSSKDIESNISEFDEFDIETQNIMDGFPPMPKDIKVAFCCEYLQEVDLKESKTIPVIVGIKYMYIDDKIISDSKNISFELDAIARVGRNYKKLEKKLFLDNFIKNSLEK